MADAAAAGLNAYVDLICEVPEAHPNEMMLIGEIIRLRARLKAIAEGRMPCLDCGNAHECKMRWLDRRAVARGDCPDCGQRIGNLPRCGYAPTQGVVRGHGKAPTTPPAPAGRP